jgi:hypothetical protein
MQRTALRDLATNIIEKRSDCFLTPHMARRSSQRFAASFCIDGKQFVHLSHNRGCAQPKVKYAKLSAECTCVRFSFTPIH